MNDKPLDFLDIDAGDLVALHRGPGAVGIVVQKHDDLWVQVLWGTGQQTKELIWSIELLATGDREK